LTTTSKSSDPIRSRGLDTIMIHGIGHGPAIAGAVVTPIFQSATFEIGAGADIVRYIRNSNTPNHDMLGAKLAALEHAEAGLVLASGMAAVSTTMLTVLAAGDHVLAQRGIYGGASKFFAAVCPSLGIEADFIDGTEPSSWGELLRPNTRAIYVEPMTNPLLVVADLHAVTDFSRHHGLVSIIDNTFATPVNFRAFEFGFDLSIHSCTKYINGHDDIVAGAVMGRAEWIDRIATRSRTLGGALDPHAAFLLDRGLKTLGVRVRQQNDSGLHVARFLAGHPAVRRVNYPGLESHPQHARAKGLFAGFGGTLSFDLQGGAEAADRFVAATELATNAPSLGGVETLVMRPSVISHASLTRQEREEIGITDGLIRLSVGLEAVEDIINDLDQAMRSGRA